MSLLLGGAEEGGHGHLALLGEVDAVDQFVGQVRLHDHVLFLAQPVLPECEEVIVEQLHAVLPPGLDRRVDPEGLVLANQVANRRGDDQRFVCRATSATDSWQQGLRDHANQRTGQLGADLVLQVSQPLFMHQEQTWLQCCTKECSLVVN